jgi:MOSC domain-containing protein YiiM
MGKCIMPTSGVFARVIKGRIINVGDEMQLL